MMFIWYFISYERGQLVEFKTKIKKITQTKSSDLNQTQT